MEHLPHATTIETAWCRGDSKAISIRPVVEDFAPYVAADSMVSFIDDYQRRIKRLNLEATDKGMDGSDLNAGRFGPLTSADDAVINAKG